MAPSAPTTIGTISTFLSQSLCTSTLRSWYLVSFSVCFVHHSGRHVTDDMTCCSSCADNSVNDIIALDHFRKQNITRYSAVISNVTNGTANKVDASRKL